MRAPKCKICGLEHWGSACHRPGLEAAKDKVKEILKTPPGKRQPRPAMGGGPIPKGTAIANTDSGPEKFTPAKKPAKPKPRAKPKPKPKPKAKP